MAYTTQPMNSLTQAAILGALDQIPTPDVVSVQILPTSSITTLQVGSPVKLVAGTSGAILVDGQTGPTDATIFGVIPYNERKNLYKAGDYTEVACSGSYMYMLSGGAIARGDSVAITAATSSADPLVNTDTTSGHFCVGYAVDAAAGAGVLVRIRIAPFTHA
jgi:hypothetical protein